MTCDELHHHWTEVLNREKNKHTQPQNSPQAEETWGQPALGSSLHIKCPRALLKSGLGARWGWWWWHATEKTYQQVIIYVLVAPLPTQTSSEDPENPVKLKNRWPRCPWSLLTATDWSHHQQVPLCPLHPPPTTAALLHSQSPAPASWMFPLMQIQAIFILIWILY